MSADVEFTLLPALSLPGLTAHQALVVEYTWLSMAIIIVSLIAVIVSLKTVPGALQNLFEMIVSFIEGYITDIMGEKGLRYFPLVITALTFILVANYIGLIRDLFPQRQISVPRRGGPSWFSFFINTSAFPKKV